MFVINLKNILEMSEAKRVRRYIRRYHVENEAYVVVFDLVGPEMIVQQFRHVRRSLSLRLMKRLRRREQLIARQLMRRDPPVFKPEPSTADRQCSTEVADVPKMVDAACNTSPMEQCDKETTTFDMTFTTSREQQTTIRHYRSSGVQAHKIKTFQSCGVQAVVSQKVNCTQMDSLSVAQSTQTEGASSSLSTQTVRYSQNFGVQVPSPGSVGGFSEEDKFNLIMVSFTELGALLRTSMSSINQLVDLSLTEARHRYKAQTFKGTQTDTSNLMQPEQQKLPQDVAENIPMPVKKKKKIGKYLGSKLWNCTLKCKACGLHMHRVGRATAKPESDSKTTQTEPVDVEEPPPPNEAAKLLEIVEVGTQTHKKKSFWSWYRQVWGREEEAQHQHPRQDQRQ